MNSLKPDCVGVQEPRIRLVATYEQTRGDDLITLAEICGVPFDEWQERVALDICALRETPHGLKWASMEAGLIVQRQNGKSLLLEIRELAGIFLWGERKIIHSAHEYKTAAETFAHIVELIESTPWLRRRTAKIKYADGEEAIVAKNGCELRFLARSNKSGRGFTAETVIFDEAGFGLPAARLGAMLPSMAARSMDGNPQIIYASSAGVAESEVLAQVRKRALLGDEKLTFLEFSAQSWDEMSNEERAGWESRDHWRADPGVWAQANPAMGLRISPEFLAGQEHRMRPEIFEREHLGVWERVGGDSMIAQEKWAACKDEDSTISDPVAFAIDVPPGRDMAVIIAASVNPAGIAHVEIVQAQAGTDWAVPRLVELQQTYKPQAIVLNAASAAGALLPQAHAAHLKTVQISGRDYATACGAFYDDVAKKKIAHLGDPLLDEAVDAARVKPLGDSLWYWNRRNAAANIAPLVAATLAVWQARLGHVKNARAQTRPRKKLRFL